MKNIILCDKCKTKFTFSIEGSFPGGKEKEDVNCPNCAFTAFTIVTSGIIRTKLLEKHKK